MHQVVFDLERAQEYQRAYVVRAVLIRVPEGFRSIIDTSQQGRQSFVGDYYAVVKGSEVIAAYEASGFEETHRPVDEQAGYWQRSVRVAAYPYEGPKALVMLRTSAGDVSNGQEVNDGEMLVMCLEGPETGRVKAMTDKEFAELLSA